jgi:hypothetical protein
LKNKLRPRHFDQLQLTGQPQDKVFNFSNDRYSISTLPLLINKTGLLGVENKAKTTTPCCIPSSLNQLENQLYFRTNTQKAYYSTKRSLYTFSLSLRRLGITDG